MTQTPQHPAASTNDHQQVLAELEASLLQRQDLDAAARETMLRHFEAALQDPASAAGLGSIGPDRAVWQQTVEMLQQEQVIDPGDRDALMRSFDEAMAPLHDAAVKAAAQPVAGDAIDPAQWQRRRAAASQPQAADAATGMPPTLSIVGADRGRR